MWVPERFFPSLVQVDFFEIASGQEQERTCTITWHWGAFG